MEHKVNIRQLGHSAAKACAELSALVAMLANEMALLEGRITSIEQRLSWKVASPPELQEPIGNESEEREQRPIHPKEWEL